MDSRTIFDEKNLIWSGQGETSLPQYDRKQSVGDVLLNTLAKYPNKIGQISDNNGIQMTNGEIRWRSIRAAQNLTNMGMGFDDVIQVIANNHHYLAPIVIGALSIGAPINAMDVQFTKDEIVHMLQLVPLTLILCDFSVLETLNGALEQLQMSRPVFTFDGSADGVQNVEVLFNETDEESFEAPSLIDANKHTAIIVCTSGTTALPKAVSLSHVSLLAKNKMSVKPDDVMLNFSSLYWLTGWSTLLATTLNSFTRVITTKQFTSDTWLDIVQRHKVTVTLTHPHFLALILQDPKLITADISSLKLYLCTGGMVSRDLCDRINKLLVNGVVCVPYAMSETAGPISINVSLLRLGSVGQLFADFDAKIINDNGDKCGIGENGEILLRPAYKFIKYYGDEQKTIEAMDSDGWFLTGDVGHFDSEGFLYLIDRKKEMLKYCNRQVSPSELESVLMQHPGVGNVCVVGIPDRVAGDLPAAVIIKSKTTGVSEDDINSIMKTKLSDAKQLRGGIFFVDELPVTPSGKVLRRKVLEIALKYRKDQQIENEIV